MELMSKPLKLPITKAQLKRAKRALSSTEYYYTEQFAQAAAKILDTLHNNKVPVRTRPVGHSLATMRVQFYQGVHYLIDHEESGHYRKLADQTVCKMRKGEFLEFLIKDNIASVELELAVPWREQLTKYLDTALPGEKFFRPDLSISNEDIEWINVQLVGLVKSNGDPMFIAQVEPGMPLLLIRDTNN